MQVCEYESAEVCNIGVRRDMKMRKVCGVMAVFIILPLASPISHSHFLISIVPGRRGVPESGSNTHCVGWDVEWDVEWDADAQRKKIQKLTIYWTRSRIAAPRTPRQHTRAEAEAR